MNVQFNRIETAWNNLQLGLTPSTFIGVEAYVASAKAAIDQLAAAPSTGPTMVELRKRLEAVRRATTS
jgi:hypothetical protein